jgi:hypothetical protein
MVVHVNDFNSLLVIALLFKIIYLFAKLLLKFRTYANYLASIMLSTFEIKRSNSYNDFEDINFINKFREIIFIMTWG